ncbi:flagellar motor protein MotB [Pseudomonas sp. CC120222-01a]|uniref:flagellar motor protein MotB n=1 Tax=Pseudomonas sp. CC120222-01a TaxID=1378075 RepID=UPI000D872B51|nr:flagellar motor protein MotB [Pseudomonas sp. CC120222-01a]PVZ40351.1 chemotaxis protein MotB [Pseudomonas sp. CC120222-01a]
MSSDQPIIIKRRKKAARGHHGGAWKIAFADFMTALMALFLVLWVLSNAGKGDKEAIAQYFSTPLLVALSHGDRNSASTSAIPGGGSEANQPQGETVRKPRPTRLSSEERRHLQALKQRLEDAVERDPKLRELKQQIAIELSPEGLRVQLLDTDKRPMFELGSARVAPYMSQLLRTFAPVLNELHNQIQISGHTDSHPYPGGEATYSNWELSADRAKASRQELVAGGLDPGKLLRVSGMSDRIRLPGAGPYDAANRRIEIIVLDSQVAARILNQDEFGN